MISPVLQNRNTWIAYSTVSPRRSLRNFFDFGGSHIVYSASNTCCIFQLLGASCLCSGEPGVPSSQSLRSSRHKLLRKTMTKKLFVGNLSFQTSDQDLSDLFAQVGKVESVSIITDRMTGRSKGFGFVEMENEAAENAITKFNGTDLDGRKLTVNEARPLVKKDFGGGGGGGGRDSHGGGRGGGGGRRDRY